MTAVTPSSRPHVKSSRPHVTVVGDVGLDVVAKLAGAVVFGHDTRATVAVAPGGAGGNTAAWLARQDVDVSLIARVGADEAGRTAASELTAAGVDCHFAIDPLLPTCCVVVLVAPDGDRTMLADRGANAAFCPADVVLPAVEGRGHLHLSGYVLLDEGSRPAGLASLARARAAGWTTSVDPQAANHIPAVGAETFLSWVAGIDLLLPNDAELGALGGVEAVLGVVTAVVVTHGRHGASWYDAEARVTVPAPQVHETDSTGAGDAFNAGLLASWLAGAPPLDSLRAGVAAGTAAAAHVGARPRA
ncbi:carbohydrate kinase family protein [Nakamurella sp. PAMC28650]|uniref:carbohydrate kinase family protein n=1 Tax=Nakamurella sp. PAMC28650 TaxID=2762325 RepID=UPI00164E5C1F|nr:PfkB family carbohydrate kinase [Nakamurella sp. PAMC28650]QNK79244.1 ribokinase [Nakamurella sp. PAMC28650]